MIKIRKNNILLTILLSLCSIFLLPFNYIVEAKENIIPPKIIGQSAIVMDIDTGEIIYSKNADNKVYPASITKLLTSLVLADNAQKSDKIIYSENAKKQPEYSLDINIAKRKIKVGDSLTASDTMSALLLFSANDLAYAISDTIGGNTEKFADMMNAKAKSLGMNNSHFMNPNGLHGKNHFSTAYDLALLGKASFDNPWVKDTINLKTVNVKTTNISTLTTIKNSNKNLGLDGCIGGKTGFTDPAGRCLLALYERSGRHLVGVVLKSAYDAEDTQVFKDMKDIIDFAYYSKPIVTYSKDTVIEELPVKYKSFRFFGAEKTINIPILLKEDIYQYENDINKSDTKLQVVNTDSLDIFNKKSNIINVSLKERNHEKTYEAYYDLSSIPEVKKANMLGFISISILGLLIIILFLLIILFKRKHKRHMSPKRFK